MLHHTFTERFFLSLIHHFSKTFTLIICLCSTFSTYANTAKVCHKIAHLNTSAINSIWVDNNTNSLLLQHDLARGKKLDVVEMGELTGETCFSSIARGLSAQKLGSQNLIMRLLKLNFDRTKTAISSLSS